MPYQKFGISIVDVVDLLGLERDPRAREGASSFNVKCPFCATASTRKYHMNINVDKNVYFCPKCMGQSMVSSGALDLYGRVRCGTPLIKNQNGKELYHKLCCELEGKSPTWKKGDVPPPPAEIEPASDDLTDRAFRALLSLPYLSLSHTHELNLRKRGLSEDAIAAGMYATLPAASSLIAEHPKAREAKAWYEQKEIGKKRAESSILRIYSNEEMLAGMIIATDLRQQNIDLHRIPGFFKLGGTWFFRYDQGMLIPTVSYEGKIVGLQVRRDVTRKWGLRYMTVSSKGLSMGATTKIARTHVAKDVDEINASTEVYVTEGPLKANVILHLLRERGAKNIAIIAVQGVNNVRELPGFAKLLKTHGVNKAYSALDMDKTGNLNVANAAGRMKQIFSDEGVTLVPLFWDEEYAIAKCAELEALCREHDIVPPQHKSPFIRIYLMATALHEKEIPYNVEIVDGKEVKNHWGPKKGYDDYLLATQ